MTFKNVFESIKLDNSSNKQDIPVKKDFNYFIEEKRPKKELLEFMKRRAKKVDIDPDCLIPDEKEEDEE